MCRLQDGEAFQELALGECITSFRGYQPWKQALELARKCQPRKKAPLAAILEEEVAKLVQGAHFFTAVRTPLDFFHGVDAFFECGGVIVTIDLTMNDQKDCCKADLLVVFEEVTSQPAVMKLATKIARALTAKRQRHSFRHAA